MNVREFWIIICNKIVFHTASFLGFLLLRCYNFSLLILAAFKNFLSMFSDAYPHLRRCLLYSTRLSVKYWPPRTLSEYEYEMSTEYGIYIIYDHARGLSSFIALLISFVSCVIHYFQFVQFKIRNSLFSNYFQLYSFFQPCCSPYIQR